MPDQKSIAVIVVAAGTGERMSGEPKQYRLLAGIPVLARTIAALLAHERIGAILPVIHPDHAERYAGLGLRDARLLSPVTGASTRQGSVLAGLRALAARKPDLVLIHDAARPFVTTDIISGVLRALDGAKAALPVLPVTDTLKRSTDGVTVAATEDRRQLLAAQTPQGFDFAAVLDAHERAARTGDPFTDDAAIAEWAGIQVTLTAGSPTNLKLTLPEDFARAELLLGVAMEPRTGSGFDVHAFTDGNAVTLGGVRIAHTHALLGHSDADVALHALCDAIYGALGEGDIGIHFPPTDARWKGAASTAFLEHAAGLVARRRGRISNLDLTIVCEVPKISPHVAAMKEAIASVCGISASRIAVKATTSEGLGFTGRREGIMAMATATIELPRED